MIIVSNTTPLIAFSSWILMDEKKGRRKLTQLGLAKIGTIGLLVKAKEIGLLAAIKPEIKILTETSFNLSKSIINTILRQANEL